MILPPRRLVLSAGRTGTVFLCGFLQELFPQATVVHEPSPTRQQMVLANLRNDHGLFSSTLRQWFEASRNRRERAARETLVELNPFLCALSDLLPGPERALNVVHIVRDPASWARSMTVFKASARFRHIIDFIPFSKPYPAPRPEGWRALDTYQKNLHRWVWCNRRLLDLSEHATRFATVRYEDIFGPDIDMQRGAVKSILNTLDLHPARPIDWSRFTKTVNPAPKSDRDFDHSQAWPIAGEFARMLGYDI